MGKRKRVAVEIDEPSVNQSGERAAEKPKKVKKNSRGDHDHGTKSPKKKKKKKSEKVKSKVTHADYHLSSKSHKKERTSKKKSKKHKRHGKDGDDELQKKEEEEEEEEMETGIPFPVRNVLAPMVGGSELAFRMLCRKYGTDLCYTPMMYSGKFVSDPQYRKDNFHTTEKDRPLVAHFCGNDPDTMVEAASMIADEVDAIDINLGCPQRIAHSGRFGSFLLKDNEWDAVFAMVRALASSLDVPIFCKIRLLESEEKTIEFCRQLKQCGCALIAVHGRHPPWLLDPKSGQRGSATLRRDGAADLNQIAGIKRALGKFPILSNGNVRSCTEIGANLDITGADGIMTAEGILDDPAIFVRKNEASADDIPQVKAGSSDPCTSNAKKLRKLHKKLREIEKLESTSQELTPEEKNKVATKASIKEDIETLSVNSNEQPTDIRVPGRLELAREYLQFTRLYPSATLSTIIFHTRRMCRIWFHRYQMMHRCAAAQSTNDLVPLIDECINYANGTVSFVYDEERQRREENAINRKKREIEKRKKYVGRMQRKARREGKPVDHYLKIGLDPPTADDLTQARKIESEELRLAWWKQNFSQHCFSFHCRVGGCQRERACAFMHFEVAGTGAADPSWLAENKED